MRLHGDRELSEMSCGKYMLEMSKKQGDSVWLEWEGVSWTLRENEIGGIISKH